MIKEVVPFPEDLGAVGMGAAEESDDSSGLWALVLIDDEVLGAWDVLLYSHLVKIKVLSMGNLNELVISNDLSIDELGIDIKVELLFDLGLGEVLRG